MFIRVDVNVSVAFEESFVSICIFSSELSLNQLKTKRAFFVRTMTEFEKYVAEIVTKSMCSSIVVNLSNRLDRLAEKYIEFDTIQSQLEYISSNLDEELDNREML